MGKLIQHNGLSLFYEEYGSGKDLLITFHGFGRSHKDFQTFKPSLSERFKVISLDLFNHGKSSYPQNRIEKNPLKKEELFEIIKVLLDELGYQRFSMLGYSLGGKVALCCLEKFYPVVDNISLIAPDGIKTNIWYDLVTQTWVGRKLYKAIIPGAVFFIGFARFLKSIGLVHKRLFDFVSKALSTRESRQMIFDNWMIFRKLQPNSNELASIINENGIKTNLIFGRYDRLIPVKIGQRFAQKLAQKDCLYIFEIGHGLINETTDRFLAENREVLFPKTKKASQ